MFLLIDLRQWRDRSSSIIRELQNIVNDFTIFRSSGSDDIGGHLPNSRLFQILEGVWMVAMLEELIDWVRDKCGWELEIPSGPKTGTRLHCKTVALDCRKDVRLVRTLSPIEQRFL